MNTTCHIVTNRKKWSLEQMTDCNHVEDEAVKDLFEYDKTVAYDPKA